MALTPKQKEFYASLDQTFNTTGWELITRGWREEQEQLPMAAFFNAQTMDDLRAARVRYGLLGELIDLPSTLAQQRLNAEETGEEVE